MAILLDSFNICPVQVFLDIVESVNLLMSSKGGQLFLEVFCMIILSFVTHKRFGKI